MINPGFKETVFNAAVKTLDDLNDRLMDNDPDMVLTEKEKFMCAISITTALEIASTMDLQTGEMVLETTMQMIEALAMSLASVGKVPDKGDMN